MLSPQGGGGSARCLVNTRTDKLVAVSRKSVAVSIQELGISNGNDHNELWTAQAIYKSIGNGPKSWSALWLHDRRYTRGTLDGDVLLIQGSKSGAITWGPYVRLDPGEYVASIVADGSEAYGDFAMDIATGKAREILAQGPANSLTREPFRSTLSFRYQWRRRRSKSGSMPAARTKSR